MDDDILARKFIMLVRIGWTDNEGLMLADIS